MRRSGLIVAALLVNAVYGLPAKDYVQDDATITDFVPKMSDLEFQKLAESLGIPVDELPVLSEADRAIFEQLTTLNQNTPKAEENNRTITKESNRKNELEMFKTWAERQINAQEEQFLEYRNWAEKQFDAMERKLEEMEAEKALEYRYRENEQEAGEEFMKQKSEFEAEIRSLESKLEKAKNELLEHMQEQEEKEKKERKRGEELLLETMKQEHQKREQLQKEHAEVIALENIELNKTQELLTQTKQQLLLEKQECRIKLDEERESTKQELETSGRRAERDYQQLENRMSLIIDSKIAELNSTQILLTKAEEKLQEQSNMCKEEKQEEKRRTDEILRRTKQQEQLKRQQLQEEHIKASRMVEEELKKTKREWAQKQVEYEQDRENWRRGEDVMRENMEREQRLHAELISDCNKNTQRLGKQLQQALNLYHECRKPTMF